MYTHIFYSESDVKMLAFLLSCRFHNIKWYHVKYTKGTLMSIL